MKKKTETAPTTQPFKTPDMFEAAALSLTFNPSVEHINGKCFFVFPAEAKALSEAYWQKSLIGNLREYSIGIRSIKDLIFSSERQSYKKFDRT